MTNKRSIINLSAPVELSGPEEGKARKFSILGYTGKVIESWWGRFIIDLAGVQTKAKVPILRDHEPSRIVGWSDKISKEAGSLVATGKFSQATQDGQEAVALADEGFPWQASIGFMPKQILILKEKQELEVNGQTVKGPMEVYTKTLVGEISLTPWGKDNDTGVTLLSQGDEVAVEIIQSENEERTMDIKELKEKHPELYRLAFDAGAASVDLETVKASAIQTERDRVTQILSEGADPEATKQAISSGVSVDGAFRLFYMAEKAQKAAGLQQMAQAGANSIGHHTPAEPQPAVADPEKEVSRMALELSMKEKISLAEATNRVLLENKPLAEQYWARFNA